MTSNRFDYIVVGGGAAGAVLAARLSEDPARAVLLLEAGPAYERDEYPEVLLDPERIGGDEEHDWGFRATAGRAGALNREIAAPRGRVLGGSSAVNATVALRALPADFAEWSAHGLSGWSWDEVLESYRALEATESGEDWAHGRSGPLPIHQRTYDEFTPSVRAFIHAAEERGYRYIPDPNADLGSGVAAVPVNVLAGIRQNTGIAYLTDDVRHRPNLNVRDRAEADRVLFSGRTAAGVQTVDGTVYDAGQVILSAGAIGSAAILLRSGIGPVQDLQDLGIDVVADLPVGQRLQDQPVYHGVYALKAASGDKFPAAGAFIRTASAGIPLSLGYRPGQSLEEREGHLREFTADSDRGAKARSGVAAAIYQSRYTFGAIGIELGYRYEQGAVVPGDEPYVSSPDPDLVYVPQAAVGCALPHAEVTDPAGRLRSTIDLVAGGSFHLLTGPGGGPWSVVCAKITRSTGLDITVTQIGHGCPFGDPYGEWRRIRGISDTGAVLVRPDGHIAWRADTAGEKELAALPNAVARLLGRDSAHTVLEDSQEAIAV